MNERTSWFDRGVRVLLVCSITLNLLQAWSIRARTGRTVRPALRAGMVVPPIAGKTLVNGRATAAAIPFDTARPTIVYVFSQQCPWCARNEASIRRLIMETAEKVKVVGVDLSTSERSPMAQALETAGVVVVREVTKDTRDAYRFSSTPDTIVVDPAGKVLAVWTGAYLGETREAIEQFFAVRLPDLATASVHDARTGGS